VSDYVLKGAPIASVPNLVRILLARAVLELAEAGYSEPGGWLLLDYEESVFWLEDQSGAPVAVLTYDAVRQWNQAVVSLVYVVPGHRKKGCFRQLLDAARRQAGLHGLTSVALGIHHANTGMQRAVAKLFMEPTFQRFAIGAIAGKKEGGQ